MADLHLSDERLQRLLDGELGGRSQAAAHAHLEACAECRRRLAEAERDQDELDALLHALDGPAPRLDAERVAAMAGAAAASASPRESGRFARESDRFARHGHPLQWAAGFVIALCLAGAAYAVPGSPVPAWVNAVAVWIGGRLAPDREPAAPAADTGAAGIAVAPGRQIVLEFTSLQATGDASITLTDDAEVVVRARGGAATFSSDEHRLVIDNAGSSATFDVRVPRAAPRVEVRVQGRTVLVKDGPRTIPGGRFGPSDSIVVPLTSPGR
jgi:anti-sigma factor RsiW